jgi:hypothetical protein
MLEHKARNNGDYTNPPIKRLGRYLIL